MKKLLLFNLLLFSVLFTTFTMEHSQDKPKKQEIPKALNEIDLSQLPKDIWEKIAPFGVRKDKQTEKEIFQDIDNLRLTSKTTKAGIDQLVSTIRVNKKKPNYSYIDFKNDIMQDLLVERAKKIVPLRTANMPKPSLDKFKEYKHEIYQQAFNSGAFNWSKNRLSIDSNYETWLNSQLPILDSVQIEKALKMGANPNSTYKGYPILYLVARYMNPKQEDPLLKRSDGKEIMKKLLEYGADPNLEPEHLKNNQGFPNIIEATLRLIGAIDDAADRIKLLLDYGKKTTVKDLERARKSLRQFSKYPEDFKEKKECEKIVKLLEETLKK